MAEIPLEKLIANICDTSDYTDEEIREELAAAGVDVDAAKARTAARTDELMRARAVRLAIAAVKANPPSKMTRTPWGLVHCIVVDADGLTVCEASFSDAAHIAAAVNAAPVLIAEVERLQGLLESARVAVEKLPKYDHHEYCNGGRECDCAADGDNDLRAKARRALGLEVGNG